MYELNLCTGMKIAAQFEQQIIYGKNKLTIHKTKLNQALNKNLVISLIVFLSG